MNRKRYLITALILALFLPLLAACQTSGQAASVSAGTPADLPPPVDIIESKAVGAAAANSMDAPTQPAPSGTPEPSDTPPPTETPTATPDLRLDPDDWRNWPVVPTFSARALEIYQRGLEMGNDPHAFSKIGDCQMINEAFFGVYALPGRYGFREGYEYLQETIDYYDGMFGRISTAVNPGFVAPSILNPMWADPELCEKGETPLSCEFRRNRPSIVLIGLEFWF